MTNLIFRKAVRNDLPAIVELLANDSFAARQEDASLPTLPCYIDAFESIDRNPDQLLMVVLDETSIVGTFQLSFLPGIALKGLLRGQIEAVRVAAARRSAGIGEAMIRWAVDTCRKRGCGIVQLTTNKQRIDAHRFYERLGFQQSHFGYNTTLSDNE